MLRTLRTTSKIWARIVMVLLVGAAACGGGGRLGDDCSVDDDCADDYRCVSCSVRNTCYFDDRTSADDDAWACEEYGVGTSLGGGAGGGSGGGSTTGACAYVDSKLNRILCGQTSASGCSGKFFGTGASCAGLSCETSSPSSCTVSGGSGGGGSGSGGGSGDGCVGTNEICNSQNASGCTITFCAGGPGGCYYVARGKRFSCNGTDFTGCMQDAAEYCSEG